MLESPVVLLGRLPRVVRVLVLGTFVNKLGTLIVPYLALVLVRDFHLGSGAVGLVMLGYGVGSMASVIGGGVLTDRLGRRRTLLTSLLGSGAIAVALAGASRIEVFVPMLIALGFLADLYRPASSAVIGDLLPSGQRAIGFAALRMAINLGFAAGMAAGGALADWSWRLLFVGDGLTTLAFGVIVYAFVPETQPAGDRPETGSSRPPLAPQRDSVFLKLLGASFLFKLAFYCAFTTLSLTITIWAGYPTKLYGLFVGLNGLMIALFEISLVHRLRHLRRLALSAVGILVSICGLAINGLAPRWPVFLAGVVIWTIGEMLSMPQQMAFVADWAPPSLRGRYLALYQVTWSLAFALNPILMLPLYGALGPERFYPLTLVFALPASALALHLDRTADRPDRLRGLTIEAGSSG